MATGWLEVCGECPPGDNQEFGFAFDPIRNVTVMLGGENEGGGTITNTTWLFDGVSWTDAAPANSPTNPWSSIAVSMCWHGGSGKIVLLGIADVLSEPETWTWDGTDWTQESPATNPGAGLVGGFLPGKMAYDPNADLCILFGNRVQQVPTALPSDETWSWDGSNWALVTPATTSPPATDSTGSQLAWDDANGVIVGFLGGNGWSSDETWIWDGSDWSNASPATTPPPRGWAAMAYSTANSTLLMFGGIAPLGGPGSALNDTWSWDGVDWTEIVLAVSPPARGTQMVDDPGREMNVIYGGYTASLHADSDTWLFESAPEGAYPVFNNHMRVENTLAA